jgi:exopolyphosphatase/guanosine-5'-triphosphate,3'-diphosphate pyrophosphatase
MTIALAETIPRSWRQARLGPAVADDPIAVIDIGSNSGRVVVVRVSDAGHLQIVADERAPLRLSRDLQATGGRLGIEALERTVLALRDFLAVARGAGAADTVAVATAAVREAEDCDAFVDAIHDRTGLDLEVIDGEQEAAYAFLGAVHGLPVEDGLLFDIGGGSLEVTTFADRALDTALTLPLGALRLSDEFLRTDPPAAEERDALANRVRDVLKDAGVGSLGNEHQVVGTGGTVRNLARMDARRHRSFIPHLHGYRVPVPRLQTVADALAGRKLHRRRSMSGLNADRADSIVGGATAVLALLDLVGGPDLLVSGQGLREGVALTALGMSTSSPPAVRRASIAALCSRFTTWDEERARRRTLVVERLASDLDPEAEAEQVEMLAHAATLLDVGRAVDYYDRYAQSARTVLGADLIGFSHRHLAILAATFLQAAGERPSDASRAQLPKRDLGWTARAGAILALADEIESRTPPGEPIALSCRVRPRGVVISAPVLAAWPPRAVGDRFRRAFRRKLVIEDVGATSNGASGASRAT